MKYDAVMAMRSIVVVRRGADKCSSGRARYGCVLLWCSDVVSCSGPVRVMRDVVDFSNGDARCGVADCSNGVVRYGGVMHCFGYVLYSSALRGQGNANF